MRSNLSQNKPQIDQEILRILARSKKEFSHINSWVGDGFGRMGEMAVLGKTVRGSLVLLSQKHLAGKITKNGITLAAAIEILHTSLLIHDDITDQDKRRRGLTTLHEQYKIESKSNKKYKSSSDLFGTSMATLVGDIGFFLFYKTVNMLDVPLDVKNEIIKECSSQFITVGFGQMQDVFFEHTNMSPSLDSIISMYTYKTARYSISLPLKLGGILSNVDQTTLSALDEIGENIGILFQLRDDELSLTGLTSVTGKRIGNDIAQNKKTVHRYYLFRNAKGSDKKVISKIFGKKKITKQDIKIIVKLSKMYKVDKLITLIVNKKHRDTIEAIESSHLSIMFKQDLIKLTTYVIKRQK